MSSIHLYNSVQVCFAKDATLSKLPLLKAQRDQLLGIQRGVERETLRIDAQGRYAVDAHPQGLGAALTHPHITTDYSEALLELVTGTHQNVASLLDELHNIHGYVLNHIGEQSLWVQSVPCTLPPEPEIPIAWYGESNEGMFKHVYRRGLAVRYGKAMQCIAGIHYNFSLPESIWPVLYPEISDAKERQSAGYMALIRNFKRESWALMYLFGASPLINDSFVAGLDHQLQPLAPESYGDTGATSLRMSDLGYQSEAQSHIKTCYNRIDNYVSLIYNAVTQPWPEYEALGTQRDGEWIQLNTSILQIENEYYASIRPKRTTRPEERPNNALIDRGVQYIEVRCLDVDPFSPLGISAETCYFLDTFLLYCATEDSPDFRYPGECEEADANYAKVVIEGRREGLTLSRQGQSVGLKEWGLALIERLRPYAELLDEALGTDLHCHALALQQAKFEDVRLTPSAQYLEQVLASGLSFNEFTRRLSLSTSAQLRQAPLSAEAQQTLDAQSQASLEKQAAIEAATRLPFEDYVAQHEADLILPETS